MRLIKMVGLAALSAMVAMAFVGATSASADRPTVMCLKHESLTCPIGQDATIAHLVLKAGTVSQLLAAINVLCLGLLIEASPLKLANPLPVHALKIVHTGCGTGSTHNNCTVSIPEGKQPLYSLLKTGLDTGVLTALSGQLRLVCANLGLDCLYDLEGMEFEVGAGHLTASETGTTELGGKFLCPNEGLLDSLLEMLPGEPRYILE